MMAVKEIALQPNLNTTVKSIAEEIKILEGITHDNLVRYYGVEIHKVTHFQYNMQYFNTIALYF